MWRWLQRDTQKQKNPETNAWATGRLITCVTLHPFWTHNPLLRSHVWGPWHQPHACYSMQGGEKQTKKGTKTWTYSCAATRIWHQIIGVNKQVRHTIAGATNPRVKKINKNALVFPRLRRRGAIAVTQGRVGLSTRTDHLLTKAADRASAEYVIHNQAPHLTATPDKCGCGDALLCLPPLAMLLTQTEAQSGFTTWFPWLLARRKPRPPASCQPHLKWCAWSPAAIYFWTE